MLTKNWTLAARLRGQGFTRISLSLVVIGAILLAAGLYGAWRVYRLQQRGSKMLSDNVASIRAAEELETVVREVQYRLKRASATNETRHLGEIAERLPEGERWLDESKQLAKSAREQQLVVRMQRGYDRVREDLQEMAPQEMASWTSLDDRSQNILNSLADEVIPNKILIYLHKYIQHNEEELAHSNQRNHANARRLILGLLLLGGCSGVAGLMAGHLIARRVSNTIVQLSLPIRDTAGKLNEVVGPMEISAQPGFEGLQSVLQNVSEHVSTVVERLQVQEREMLRAEQLAAVGQLAAGMAHELRNPLTAVKAVLQLAESSHDLSQRDLQVLNEEVGRLERSVQQFLDFARPPQLEKRCVELGPLLQQCVELVARRAQLQGIRLELETPPRPIHVTADATQLRQVILNLVLNGCDAVSRGGMVRVETDDAASASAQCDAPGGPETVTIRIRDSGPGLPADLGERIFEPFVSTKETGLGLGLSICRKIVETHGGSVSAANDPSGGAVFSVSIPRDAPSTADGACNDHVPACSAASGSYTMARQSKDA